jgi:Cu+-exporting ATPase
LTKGRPELVDHRAFDHDWNELLAMIAAAEDKSEHPIARALVTAAREANLELPDVDSFDSKAGYGIEARVGGRQLVVGADRFLESLGIDIGEGRELARAWSEDAMTPLYAAVDGRLAAALSVSDPLKEGSAPAIAALRQHGLRVAMLSGDNRRTAEAMARRAGIERVMSEVTPDAKAREIERLQAEGHRVAFVGDGINDAPALTAATVGVAFGQASDITAQAAGAVILDNDLARVDELFHIGRRMRRIALQSALGGMALSVIGMLVAAVGLLPPVAGAVAQEVIDVLAVLNALRAALAPAVLRDY